MRSVSRENYAPKRSAVSSAADSSLPGHAVYRLEPVPFRRVLVCHASLAGQEAAFPASTADPKLGDPPSGLVLAVLADAAPGGASKRAGERGGRLALLDQGPVSTDEPAGAGDAWPADGWESEGRCDFGTRSSLTPRPARISTAIPAT